MKKLFVITGKVLLSIVGLYAAVCLVALIAGAAHGLAIRLSPAGRAEVARINAQIAEINDRAASSHDQH